MKDDMTLVEFKRLLEIHGGDFSRWPVAAVRPACRLLEADAAARAAHSDALALDGMLALHRPGPVPDIVAARVAQAIERAPGRPLNDNFAGLPSFARRGRAAQWALAACAVLALGFALRPAVVPERAPQRVAAVGADEVELFLLAMADPFIETLRAEALMAPLETAALRQGAYDVDMFLDDVMGEEWDLLAGP